MARGSESDGDRRPYDCLLVPRGLLARVAAERRRRAGGRSGAEPAAWTHYAMLLHAFERYGHLLGLNPGNPADLGRLRGKQVAAGQFANHDLFALDDDDFTLLVPKGMPGAGRLRYELTPLADRALVGRLIAGLGDPGGGPLPDPVPVPVPPGEDPAAHERRLQLMRIRDGQAAPGDDQAEGEGK